MLSPQLFDQAQARSMSLVIAKCGFNRHTARDLIFAQAISADGGFFHGTSSKVKGKFSMFCSTQEQPSKSYFLFRPPWSDLAFQYSTVVVSHVKIDITLLLLLLRTNRFSGHSTLFYILIIVSLSFVP
jgi:hypothetical protein